MQVERITQMKYAGQSGRRRQQLSESRKHYEKQFKLRNPGTCYGAGLAVLTIKHKGDPEGQELFVIPLEITTLDAGEQPCSFWMELLAKRLQVGVCVDPDTDYEVRDEVLRMHARNAARTETDWEWDADDEAGSCFLYLRRRDRVAHIPIRRRRSVLHVALFSQRDRPR